MDQSSAKYCKEIDKKEKTINEFKRLTKEQQQHIEELNKQVNALETEKNSVQKTQES